MNPTLIATLMAAFLTGNVMQAILGFVTDRRKNRGDFEISRLDALQAYNSYLLQRIREVDVDLDNERRKRREAESAQAAQSVQIALLEARVAELERKT